MHFRVTSGALTTRREAAVLLRTILSIALRSCHFIDVRWWLGESKQVTVGLDAEHLDVWSSL